MGGEVLASAGVQAAEGLAESDALILSLLQLSLRLGADCSSKMAGVSRTEAWKRRTENK
jgi:hypothetical protein